MAQLICLVSCGTCGNVEEVYIPLTQNIVVNEEIVYKICHSKLPSWDYDDETLEWMCKSCAHKPFHFKISHEIMRQLQANINKETWAWENLVKKEIAAQMDIDSDLVRADEVLVKAYMNPMDDAVEFHISPVGMSWLDIKKRHPVKESKNRVP